MKFCKDVDGSARIPNDTQKLAMQFIQDVWGSHKVIGINQPVGTGKSLIARAIQRAVPGTVIIAPNNTLLKQYLDTYPELVKCIGETHYTSDLDCFAHFTRYLSGEPAIFNPASFWYKTAGSKSHTAPKCIIVDEADGILGMLKDFGTRSYTISRLDMNKPLRTLLLERYSRAEAKKCKGSSSKAVEALHERTFRTARDLYLELEANAHLYTHKYTREFNPETRKTVYKVHIVPLTVPAHIHEQFFGTATIVLLSATLTAPDLVALTGQQGVYKSFPSNIPVESRTVYAGDSLLVTPNYGVDIREEIRPWIDRLKPFGNGLIHATYADAQAWGNSWEDVLTHTSHNKATVITKFRREGGILLGAGMAAGVDLPGDFCRWNLIPRLQYANLGDPEVQKRKALADGQQWYELETLRHLMQATGRSTRHAGDWSIIVILDPRFAKLFNKHRSSLPVWFTESVCFQRKDYNELLCRYRPNQAV